jgi:hypothetical protein
MSTNVSLESANSKLTLQLRVTCPHCWHEFAPEDTLWISEHPDLLGDPRLGINHAIRFLPSRFTAAGEAIDSQGYACTRVACPNCHLEISRPLFQIAPIFFSILGAPASGKSYFLASMTWKLRQTLPQYFGVAMNDTDTTSNSRLHDYEEQQFMNPNPEALVALAKTDVQGDMYDTVIMGQQSVLFPRPFLFTLQPMHKHKNHNQTKKVSRIMCLYDNAGESFLPGADKATSPVTRHLALSRCLFFLFDPTQDPRFRYACKGISDDPQMQIRNERLSRENSTRQDTILIEAIQRVRRFAGLRDDELHQRPLVIVVTKWDSWQKLIPELSTADPFRTLANSDVKVLDHDRITQASEKVGQLLRKLTPELVSAAEGFARELIFIPVSATGRAPEVDSVTGGLGIRPKDIQPFWAEVPMLYALSRFTGGLVGGYTKAKENRESV